MLAFSLTPAVEASLRSLRDFDFARTLGVGGSSVLQEGELFPLAKGAGDEGRNLEDTVGRKSWSGVSGFFGGSCLTARNTILDIVGLRC